MCTAWVIGSRIIAIKWLVSELIERDPGISGDDRMGLEVERLHFRMPTFDEDGTATCRTWADAPEIDGYLFIEDGTEGLAIGDVVSVTVEDAGEYDLWGLVKENEIK